MWFSRGKIVMRLYGKRKRMIVRSFTQPKTFVNYLTCHFHCPRLHVYPKTCLMARILLIRKIIWKFYLILTCWWWQSFYLYMCIFHFEFNATISKLPLAQIRYQQQVVITHQHQVASISKPDQQQSAISGERQSSPSCDHQQSTISRDLQYLSKS